MALISVIVPVYNVEKYIHRCIDSILSQTFTDFELILVDDGSPDQCPQICDRYAEQDSRIHVIHQKNGGLSAARNAGIDWAFANSKSQWLTFVDSDDWVHPELLERLYDAALEKRVNISVCKYQRTNGDNLQVESAPVQLWTPEDFYVQYNVNATVAWGKLYKKEFFSILRYPVEKIHEDEFITYWILFSNRSMAVVDAPLYAYFRNPDGIMGSKWTPKRLDGLQAKREQLAFFKNNNYKKAEIRAAKALLWGTKEQLEAANSLHYTLYIKKLKKNLRKSIYEYKSLLNLGPESTPDLYEAAYPYRMKMFWLGKAFLRKRHLKRK